MRLIVPLCFLLSACSYVSGTEYKNRLSEMDDDGDGATIDDGDCAPNDPEIHPAAVEIWYDGIDQDCQGDNDFDADKDDFYWGVDGDPQPDCDDNNPMTHPNASDIWYDGIDSDCREDNDFDKDGDGYECNDATDPADCQGSAGTDCNDDDPNVFLDAPDTWWDGIDSDCREDNDFDADLDGQCNKDFSAEAGDLCQDCNDTDPLIYMGAPDTWYDGVDSDCLENNDYDQDGDGHDCDDDTAITGDCDGHVGTDCDDTDATTNGAQVELLSDTVDHDCDGDGKRFLTEDLGYLWTNPNSAIMAANDLDLYLSLVAERAEDIDGTEYFDTAVALRWPISNIESGPQEMVSWQNSFATDPLGLIITPGQGFLVDNANIYGVTGTLFGTNRFLTFTSFDLNTGSQSTIDKSHNSTEATYCPSGTCAALNSFSDISMDLDAANGVFHSLGCDHDDTGNVQYLRISQIELAFSTLDPSNPSGLHNVGANPSTCTVSIESGTTGKVVFADEAQGGRRTDWSFETGSAIGFNPSVTAVDNSLSVDDLARYTHFSGGLTHIIVSTATSRIYVEQNNSQWVILPDSGNTPIQATAAEDAATGQIFVAWTEHNGGVGLAWGNMTSGFSAQATVSSTISADEVHVATPDGQNVMVAVIGDGEVHAGFARLP